MKFKWNLLIWLTMIFPKVKYHLKKIPISGMRKLSNWWLGLSNRFPKLYRILLLPLIAPQETDGKLLLQKILCPGNAEIRSPWNGNNLNTSLVKIIFPGMRRFHKNFKMKEKWAVLSNYDSYDQNNDKQGMH